MGIEYITKSGGSDCFCDAFNSEEAKLQEAYIFTEGITNGYIKVSGGEDFVLGDVNNDGSIDSGDASDILLAYSNTQTGSSTGLDERAEKAANVNGDQYIDSNDASVVLAYYAYTQTGGHGSLEEYLSSDPGQ
ncbi:MAG TPA: dockerin type I domain-containing protein [Ruminococcus sp.]|nr:dockerin type I domain-containing protein [Ruminococcus sp.]